MRFRMALPIAHHYLVAFVAEMQNNIEEIVKSWFDIDDVLLILKKKALRIRLEKIEGGSKILTIYKKSNLEPTTKILFFGHEYNLE